MQSGARTCAVAERAVLLVSLCNVETPSTPALLAVDPVSWAIEPLTMSGGAGATGMCVVDDQIVVVYQAAQATVAVLDKQTLGVRREAPLPGARDVHSVAAWNGGIAVASSGTDEVLWYRDDGSGFVDRTVLWSAGEARKDVAHVNGLTAHGDALVCSAFGPRTSDADLWSTSQDGYVHDIVNDRRMLDGLSHPHSVAFRGGELFLCESSRRSFRSADRAIVDLDGYTRGVAFLDERRMVIGTSRARKKSRSSARLLNPGSDGIDAGTCALHVADLDGAVHTTIPLGDYGREIYDVLHLG